MSSNPSELFTPFLPTTVNIPEEPDRLNTFLVDRFANYADVINDKKIGMYVQSSEGLNGNKLFYDSTKVTRNGYQYLARVTQYPNAGVLVLDMPDNVNPQFRLTHTWGSASKPCSATGAGDGIYFSFMNQGDVRVSFTLTDLAITITTTVDLTTYDGYIFLEYVRDGD